MNNPDEKLDGTLRDLFRGPEKGDAEMIQRIMAEVRRPAPVPGNVTEGSGWTPLVSAALIALALGLGYLFLGRSAQPVAGLPPLPVMEEGPAPEREAPPKPAPERPKLSPEVQKGVDRALSYLSRLQEAGGSWSDTQYPSNTGVTALASLALMAEGSAVQSGRFGRHLDQATNFLLANVQPNGAIAGKGVNPYGPMYEHCLSLVTLSIAKGKKYPGNLEALTAALENGAKAIRRSQLLDGGWRYHLSREGKGDSSVTSNVLWALAIADHIGGLGKTNPDPASSSKSVALGMKFLGACALPDGLFRYRYWGLHGEASLSGLAALAMQESGHADHALVPQALGHVVKDFRTNAPEELKKRRYFAYGCFYASMAIYQASQDWEAWYPKAAEALLAMQNAEGEVADEFGNKVYPTAMAAVIWQAPLGHLPLYHQVRAKE